MRSIIVALSVLLGIAEASGAEYVGPDEAYFASIDEKTEKANLRRIEEMYDACSRLNSSADIDTVEGTHIYFRAKYKCYKDVVLHLIDTFQPRVADEVKRDFTQYLEAYDKMMYNQYFSLDPCGGSCGTIIEDYIVVDRAVMLEKVAKDYISAVSGYVNM